MGNQTKSHSSVGTERNLSDDQIARIVQTANANPKLRDLRDIVQLLADTGLRRSELAVLPWSGVDVAKSSIFVLSSMSRYGGRYVPFGSSVAGALESLRQRRPGSELVLGDDASRLLRRCALQLKSLTAEIGIPDAGLHAFRRAAILRGFASGIAIHTLAAIYGYSAPTLTARHYLNSAAQAEHLDRIRKSLDSWFRS